MKQLIKICVVFIFQLCTVNAAMAAASSSSPVIEDRVAKLLQEYTVYGLSQFVTMSFEDAPQSLTKYHRGEALYKMFCNQEGYNVSTCQNNGHPLTLTNSGEPIGYNIHLPYGEVKAIFVTTYSGYDKRD